MNRLFNKILGLALLFAGAAHASETTNPTQARQMDLGQVPQLIVDFNTQRVSQMASAATRARIHPQSLWVLQASTDISSANQYEIASIFSQIIELMKRQDGRIQHLENDNAALRTALAPKTETKNSFCTRLFDCSKKNKAKVE